jgi:hypothetical protein
MLTATLEEQHILDRQRSTVPVMRDGPGRG